MNETGTMSLMNSMLGDIMQAGMSAQTLSATGADSLNGLSFGDVLSAASGTGNSALLQAALQTDNTGAGLLYTDDAQDDSTYSLDLMDMISDSNRTASFSELVEILSQKLTSADSDAVNAAALLLEMQGRAAATFFGTQSDTDGESSLTDIFDMLAKLEDMKGSDGLEALDVLETVSELTKTGLTEQKDAEEITDTLEEVLKNNDSDNVSLANAVLTVIAEFSPQSADNGGDKIISEEGVKKLTEIIDSLRADNEASIVKLFGFKSAQTELMTAVTGAASGVHINDAGEQLGMIAKMNGEPNPTSANVTSTNVTSTTTEIEALASDNSGGTNSYDAAKESGSFAQELEKAEVDPKNAALQLDPEPEFKISGFTYEAITKTTAEQLSEPLETALNGFNGADGASELTVVLKPENLGEIAVKVVSENGTVSVVISAQNPEVNKALAENAAALAENLARRNVEVGSINIVAPTQAGYEMGLDFTNQGFNRRDDSGGGEAYGTAKAVEGVEEAPKQEETLMQKEAALWATA